MAKPSREQRFRAKLVVEAAKNELHRVVEEAVKPHILGTLQKTRHGYHFKDGVDDPNAPTHSQIGDLWTDSDGDLFIFNGHDWTRC